MMIRNYFKTAIRSLLRNKTFTVINVVGLAAGISVCTLIFVVIQFQSSFDDFHSKKDRIFRVLTEYHHADAPDVFFGKAVPYPLPQGLKTAFPMVEQVAPVLVDHNDQILLPASNGVTNKKFKEENGVFYTQPSLFKIFDYPLLAGSYNSLNDPNNALIEKETAEKYFGSWRDAIGKTLELKTSYDNEVLKITGILDKIPDNTDLNLKLVVAMGTGFTGGYVAKSTSWDGTSSDFGCYLLLPPHVSASDFNPQLRAFVKKMKSPDNKDSHIIEPLANVHFNTGAGDFSNKTMSKSLINALWLIAAFILVIACVNFINLSTAQAVNRAKEVGVRKVLGGNKWQLKMQFFTETFLITLFSVFSAFAISILVLPGIDKLLTLPLTTDRLYSSSILLFLALVTGLVTLLAGFYPSVVLSRFNPINALKSKLQERAKKGISLRRGLVVFQFVIAQALIIGTLIIVRQMNYFIHQPLGFDKTAIANIPFPTDSLGKLKITFLQKNLSAISGIEQVSFNSNTPVEDNNDMWSTFRFDRGIKETDFYAITKFADDHYVNTYKLTLVAGRNLQPSDTVREFLVNEMLVKKLGINDPQKILGREISIWGDNYKGEVVGILKDFNERSFRADQAPLLVASFKNLYTQAAVKLSTAKLSSTMRAIEKTWSEVYPDFVFEYKFLDDKVASFYQQEEQLSELYKIFAAIAILLSCLGLYGLASFMAVQRIKEVGIRKVLGAGVGNIIYLFSKEFIVLISIAFAIASPIAWYYMHKWLQDYPYRITISWWIFIAGGILAILIALLTVSFQALKAAMTSPVKSLRAE